MVSSIKSQLGALLSTGIAEFIQPDPQAPVWSVIPPQDTNFKDLPATLDVRPYVTAYPPITDWDTTVGTIDDGILTIPEDFPIGDWDIVVTATNPEGSADSASFVWVISVEDAPAVTLYINSILAGGAEDGSTPPDNHALGFDTANASWEIDRDNVTHVYTTQHNPEGDSRWYIQASLQNQQPLEVGVTYFLTIQVECLAGGTTNFIGVQNSSGITLGADDRQVAPGESKVCFISFTIDEDGYEGQIRFGTGITTQRREDYRFKLPQLREIGQLRPVFEIIPDQYTLEDDLPGTLDLTQYVSSVLPGGLFNWTTTEGEVDEEGLLTIPVGTPLGVLDIIVSVDNNFDTGVSEVFTWTIDDGEEPPVWESDIPDFSGTVDDLPATYDLNNHVTSVSELINWALSGNPVEITLDQNGLLVAAVGTPVDAYELTAYVENDVDGSTSNTFTVIVADVPPVWDTIPDHDTNDADGPSTYDVTSFVTSAIPITAWSAVGAEIIDGVVQFSADVNDLTPAEITVTATNAEGDGVSNQFTWTRTGAGPSIDQQPEDLEVTTPDGGSFTVGISHPVNADITYGWQAEIEEGVWQDAAVALSDVESSVTPTMVLNSTVEEDTSAIRCLVRAYQDTNDHQDWSEEADLTVTAIPAVPPSWDTVPDFDIPRSEMPTTRDMNDYVTPGDADLALWALTNTPTGITIGILSGVINIFNTIAGTETLEVTVTDGDGESAVSNEFDIIPIDDGIDNGEIYQLTVGLGEHPLYPDFDTYGFYDAVIVGFGDIDPDTHTPDGTAYTIEGLTFHEEGSGRRCNLDFTEGNLGYDSINVEFPDAPGENITNMNWSAEKGGMYGGRNVVDIYDYLLANEGNVVEVILYYDGEP